MPALQALQVSEAILIFMSVSAAFVGFGTAAEVDAAVNIIRSQSHRLASVVASHEKVPILSICSQLCVSMAVDNSSCQAFSFDPTAKVCKLSTQPSIGTNDSAASMVFDVTGVTKQTTDCREQFAHSVKNVTFHDCATLLSSNPNADGEMSYNHQQNSCIPVLPQPPESLNCASGQDTWLRYTDLSISQIYGVPTQISLTGPYKSTTPYPCNCVPLSNVFDGNYGSHYTSIASANPYLSGDMGAEYILAGAVFVARQCCSGNHNLHFLAALVEDDLSLYDESICAVWPGPPDYPAMMGNEKAWFPCPLKRARYFKLTMFSSDIYFNVAELELYGY